MADYPSGVPTFLIPKNFIKVDTASAISSGDTTIPLVDASALPTGGGYLVADNESLEIIKYTGISGNNLTGCTRGDDGSSASSQPASTNLEMRWNAAYLVQGNQNIINMATDLRNCFASDLDDSVSPAATASNLEGRMDMFAAQLKNIISGVDWKDSVTLPINTLAGDVAGKVSKSGDTMNGNLIMDNQSYIQFVDSGGTNGVTLVAPASVSGSYTLNLPTAQSSGVRLMENDGSGNLSWRSLTDYITDAMVNSSAAITLTKLATLTANRMVISNGSGYLAVASMTVGRMLISDANQIPTHSDWAYSSGDLTTSPEGAIKFADSAGTNYFTLKSPASVTSYSIVWPSAQGGVDTYLKNDGAGNMTWVTLSGGGGTVSAGLQYEIPYYPVNGNTVNGSTYFIHNGAHLVSLSYANVGASTYMVVENSDNTDSGSGAWFLLRTGGTSAGDPRISFHVNGANYWNVGVDNSDSRNFKWSYSSGTDVGTGAVLVLTPNGNMKFVNGAVGTPSVANINYAGGIFWPNTNQITITPDGTAQFNITSTQIRCTPNGGLSLGADGNAFSGLFVLAGSVGAPSIAFSGDATTGIWHPAASAIGFSIAGTNTVQIDSSKVYLGKQVLSVDGAVGTPTYSFLNDPNSGMYSISADVIGFSTGGGLQFTIENSWITCANTTIVPAGNSASPSLVFSGDTDTGLYSHGTNYVGISCGGAQAAYFGATFFSITGTMIAAKGTTPYPSYSFGGDTDTGIGSSAPDTISFYAGANGLGMEMNGNGRLYVDNGGNGGFSFLNDTDNYFALTSADTWNFYANSTQFGGGGHDGTSTYWHVPGGSVSHLGLRFISDVDTGIYSLSANAAVLAAQGAAVMTWRNDSFLAVEPGADNTVTLGRSGVRWTAVWAVNGSIQTSHSTFKKDIREIADIIVPKGIYFKWNDGDQRDNIGFLADPLPTEAYEYDESGKPILSGVRTNAVIGMLCGGWWKHEDRIKTNEEKIKELEAEIKLLKEAA